MPRHRLRHFQLLNPKHYRQARDPLMGDETPSEGITAWREQLRGAPAIEDAAFLPVVDNAYREFHRRQVHELEALGERRVVALSVFSSSATLSSRWVQSLMRLSMTVAYCSVVESATIMVQCIAAMDRCECFERSRWTGANVWYGLGRHVLYGLCHAVCDLLAKKSGCIGRNQASSE